MENILFVCTGNTCRSSMAEAIFRELIKGIEGSEKVKILSAGTWATEGQKASRNAIEALKDKGIDLCFHVSKPLTKEMVEDADLILTMTENHKMQIRSALPHSNEKLYTLKEFTNGKAENINISDPYGQNIEVYRACADEIEAVLKKVISEMFLD